MMAFEVMIGMVVMAQTRSQCLSSSGINENKADQASSESSHGNNSGFTFGSTHFQAGRYACSLSTYVINS
jgi:hypothetical protein